MYMKVYICTRRAMGMVQLGLIRHVAIMMAQRIQCMCPKVTQFANLVVEIPVNLVYIL
jgi:hypothetical protein